MSPSKTALFSVHPNDFNGPARASILGLARYLKFKGWHLLGSAGSAKTLNGAEIPTQSVSDFVGGGPILDGRVNTLSREVHAMLLARYLKDDDNELERLGLPRVELVVSTLYPLKEAIAEQGATIESVIKNTDVGGPGLRLSSAKGGRIIICDPADIESVIAWLEDGRPDNDVFIQRLRAKAYFLVSQYVMASATFHSEGLYAAFFGTLIGEGEYGENPSQNPARFYALDTEDPLALHKFKLVTGRELSWNGRIDANRLLQTVTHIAAAWDVNIHAIPYIAVAVKHGNPCGAGVSTDSAEDAVRKMIDGNLLEIHGASVMTNFPIAPEIAELLLSYHQEGEDSRKLDGIFAPLFSEGVESTLERKKGKCRMMANSALHDLTHKSLDTGLHFVPVRGGFQTQPNFTYIIDLGDPALKRYGDFTAQQETDVLLAWAIGATSDSNTVDVVRNGMLLANGTGQRARVNASNTGVDIAHSVGHDLTGGVAFSDSFFINVDAIQVLLDAGVTAIYSCSGSKLHDPTIVEFCKDKVALWLIPVEIGRAFFGHA